MKSSQISRERLLETLLALLATAVACVMYFASGFGKIAVLNLFFLPVLLGGFFLGRNRAALLTLLSVALVAVVCALDQELLSETALRGTVTSSIALWGAVLGLAALLVGTLADALAAKSGEMAHRVLAPPSSPGELGETPRLDPLSDRTYHDAR